MSFEIGDILFVRGETPVVSSLIKSFLHSEYSHVAIAVGPNEICEIDVFQNMRILPNPYTNYDVYRYKQGLSIEQKKQLHRFLMQKTITNTGYDWGKIAELLIRHFLHWNVLIDEKNRYICSEVIDVAYQTIGIDLLPAFLTGDVTPADLLLSILLIKVEGNERIAS
jgi:hypothetical protein